MDSARALLGRYLLERTAPREWALRSVPIFAAHTRKVGGKSKTFDKKWLAEACREAGKDATGAYLARLHVWHHGGRVLPLPVGFVANLRLGSALVQGVPTTAIIADFLGLDDETAERLRRRELPYVSVEILDADVPAISSAALLPTEEPYFHFPLITTRETAAVAASHRRTPRACCPVLLWRNDIMPEQTQTLTPPVAPAAPAPEVKAAAPADPQIVKILETVSALEARLAALEASLAEEPQMAEKMQPVTAPAETLQAAAKDAQILALKAGLDELRTEAAIREEIETLRASRKAFDPAATAAQMRTYAKKGITPKEFSGLFLAAAPVAPAPAKPDPAAPPETDEVKWTREHASRKDVRDAFPDAKDYLAFCKGARAGRIRLDSTTRPYLPQHGRSRFALVLALALVLVAGLSVWHSYQADAALSADATMKVLIGSTQNYPVASSTTIYAGGAVGMKADGYCRALVAGDRFVGHAVKQANNASGSDGDIDVQCYGPTPYRLQVTLTSAVADLGKPVFASADNTYTLDPTNSAYSRVGKLVEYIDGTYSVVEFHPNVFDGMIYIMDAAGDALTNSTDETALCSVDIPASALNDGDMIEVFFQGIATTTSDSDTLTLKLYADTEEIAASDATDVANSNIGIFHAYIIIRTDGGSGTLVASGLYTKTLAAEGTATALPFFTASATEATNATFTIAVKGTWSAADTDNSCRADVFWVKLHRKDCQ